MISDEKIKELINKLDIVKVVGEYVDLKKAGTSYKGLCPFHNDTNPSFYVNPEKQFCKCFVCGTGGDVISFYEHYKNVNFNQAIIELSKQYKIDLGINLEKEMFDENDKYYTIMKDAHNYFQENIFTDRNALEYLSKRNFDTDTIKKHQIGFASAKWSELYEFLREKGYEDEDLLALGLIKKSEKGKIYDTFRNRIIFPIFSPNNHIIAFGGRTLEKDTEVPKYINSPDTPIFKKSYNLFGIEKGSNIRNKDYSILMEGYIDVLTANNYGFDTCLAPLGTALTLEQAKLLKKYSSNVLLCFDSDKAGILATEKAILLLKSQGFNIKIIRYTETKDPDDFFRILGKDKFLEKVQTSVEAFDFLYDTYIQEYDIENNIMAKDNFIKSFTNFFLSIKDDMEKELYFQKFSEKVKIDIEILKKTILSNKKISRLARIKETTDSKEDDIKLEQVNEIELKMLKVLFTNPNFISLLNNEILLSSKSDFYNLCLEFFKSNYNSDNLVKNFKEYFDSNAKSKEYETEMSSLFLDILITDTQRKTLEIIKSYFRFKIKEVLDKTKNKYSINPMQKKEFIQISTNINLANNFEKLEKISYKLNSLIQDLI